MAPKEESVELKAKGNKYFASHEWLNAIESYTKAIEMYDQDPSYYCNRAQVTSPRTEYFWDLYLMRTLLRPTSNSNSMVMLLLTQLKLLSSTLAMLRFVVFLPKGVATNNAI